MNRILAFAGSTRTDSFNKKILKSAIYGAREAGADVTVIDLRDFPMPLYDGDLESSSGIPEYGKRLKELFNTYAPESMMAIPILPSEVFYIAYNNIVSCPDLSCKNFKNFYEGDKQATVYCESDAGEIFQGRFK